MSDQLDSFSAMLKWVLGARLADADGFVAMLADDGVMEFPYAPPGMAKRLEGRAAVARHLADLSGQIAFDRIGDPAVHDAGDGETVILEFEGFGRGTGTGEPHEQRYISVIRTRGGQIVLYRDYWNPLVLLRAVRGKPFVDALTEGTPGHG